MGFIQLTIARLLGKMAHSLWTNLLALLPSHLVGEMWSWLRM